MIKILCLNDNVEIECEKDFLNQLLTVDDMLKEITVNDSSIPIQVSSKNLKIMMDFYQNKNFSRNNFDNIVEYKKKMTNNETPTIDEYKKWQDFKDIHSLNLNIGYMMDLCASADYLNYSLFMDYICIDMALQIEKCKTTEEIGVLLNIESDYTPEETEQLKEELKYLENSDI